MQIRQTPHNNTAPMPIKNLQRNEWPTNNGPTRQRHTQREIDMPTRHAPISRNDRIFRVQEKNRKPHPSSRNRKPYHLIMYLSKLKYIKNKERKIFEGDLIIKTLSTTLLQIFGKLMLQFKVIFKSMIGPDDTRQVDLQA